MGRVGSSAIGGGQHGRSGGPRAPMVAHHGGLLRLGLVDLGLAAVALLMRATDQTVLFFHLIFVLLSVGAFSWALSS